MARLSSEIGYHCLGDSNDGAVGEGKQSFPRPGVSLGKRSVTKDWAAWADGPTLARQSGIRAARSYLLVSDPKKGAGSAAGARAWLCADANLVLIEVQPRLVAVGEDYPPLS